MLSRMLASRSRLTHSCIWVCGNGSATPTHLPDLGPWGASGQSCTDASMDPGISAEGAFLST